MHSDLVLELADLYLAEAGMNDPWRWDPVSSTKRT